MPQSSMSSRLSRNAFAFVLAGGRGSRLKELTDRRAKPAVHFGGKTRIIDFALSNALNSGIRRIGVATQYKAHSLIRHLQRGWNFLRPERNESFDILPASQRVSETQWYEGTADAVYQNIDILEDYGIDHVVVLAGDHVYKMDYEIMLEQHVAARRRRDRRLPRGAAHGSHGVRRDARRRARPDRLVPGEARGPAGHPGQPRHGAGQHGHLRVRRQVPLRPAAPRRRRPELGARFRQRHHPLSGQARQSGGAPVRQVLRKSKAESEDYWRDAGTVDAYFEANMDLTRIVPALDLYDRNWPIWTYAEITPPAKFVHDEDGRRGKAVSSLVSGGCIVSGRLPARHAAVHRRACPFLGRPDGCVVLPEVEIGRHARLSRVVDRPRRADPGGPGGRRGSGTRRPALPPHRAWHLPGHAADDRPAGRLSREELSLCWHQAG